MPRPDFSDYVAHFTKSALPFGVKDNPEHETLRRVPTTAYERLVSILEKQAVWATPMPWTNAQAVAFTECPWGSLLRHAAQYSPYGVGFTKPHLFAAGGGPAIYLRQDMLASQRGHLAGRGIPPFHYHIWTFVTPFVPDYAPQSHRDEYWNGRTPIDFTHEREWRVSHDFTFRYDQVQFVILDTYEDMARFPTALKDEIGRDRFLIMDVYRKIEEFWPIHIVD